MIKCDKNSALLQCFHLVFGIEENGDGWKWITGIAYAHIQTKSHKRVFVSVQGEPDWSLSPAAVPTRQRCTHFTE